MTFGLTALSEVKGADQVDIWLRGGGAEDGLYLMCSRSSKRASVTGME